MKYYQNKEVERICKDEEMSYNIDQDQTKIMTVLDVVNAFSTFRLVIVIFMVSYFIGIFFYIFCDLTSSLESVQHKGGSTTDENGNQIKFSP